MNNTIFRRKFVFGVLIALMFGLGVHGIVEALTFSGFRDNINLGTTTSSGINVVQARNAPDPDTDAIEGSFTFTVSNARDGDKISIKFTSGNGTIGDIVYTTRPGSFTEMDITNGKEITFTGPALAPGEFTVDYSFIGGYGLYQITVDSPQLVPSKQKIVGSTYIVQSTGNARTFEVDEINTPEENVGLGRGLMATVTDMATDPTDDLGWTQINFKITDGYLVLNNGDLYLKNNRIYTVTASEEIFTSLSIFTERNNITESVTVRPKSGTTAKVTVDVEGSAAENASREITYFYGPVDLDRVSGNIQVGYSGQSLSNSLVVRVSDGGSRSRGVSGQRVTFTIGNAPNDIGFSPAAGATLAPESEDNFPVDTIHILTNSSGEARVNYSDLPTESASIVTARVYTNTNFTDTDIVEEEEFTAYIVRRPTTETIADSSTPTPQQRSGFLQGIGNNPVSVVTSATHVGVQFTITGGSLYLDPGHLDLASPNYVSNLFVSSGAGDSNNTATVNVRVNSGSTAKVTATIPGSTDRDGRTHVVYYFYDDANLEEVSGNNQIGNFGTQLGDPLIVQVLDGTRPVAGQEVTFRVTEGTLGTLVKDPGFPDALYDDNFPDTATVTTDSDGKANVVLQLSEDPDPNQDSESVENTVTATFTGQTVTFTASAVEASDAARITIVSGNNQRASLNHELTDPLIVIVHDVDGFIVENVNVRFSTDSGAFAQRRDDDPGTPDPDSSTATNRSRTVATDETGRAAVRFNVGDISGAKRVKATVIAYDRTERDVVFNINGTGTTTPDPGQPGTTTLRVSRTSITGTPGQLVSVNVTGASPNASVQISSFSLRGLASGTANANGSVTITFNLPSTTGTHNVNVTSGGQTVRLTLNVQTSTTTTGSLVVFPSSVSGAPGDVENVSITASDGQSVAITITGPFRNSPITGRTGSFTLAIADGTSRGTYTARVFAVDGSYNSTSFTVTVTGTTTPTPTQDDVRIQRSGSGSLSGTTGTPVTLEARVVDNSNQQVGVSGVNVDFYNSSNRLLESTRTNSRGYAFYSYSILASPTIQTVTAEVNDSDYTVHGQNLATFTITSTGAQPTTSTLTIIQTNSAGQTSNIGAPGALHTIRVLLPERTANQRVILDVVRTNDRTNVGTYVLSSDVTGTATTPNTFRLPTTAGTYTITATAGTNTATATLTVFAIKLVKDSSDSVSGDDQEGNRGEVLDDPFALRVVRNSDNTAVQGVDVTFRVTDGNGELSASSSATSGSSSLTVRSDSNGDVKAYLVLDEDQEDNEVTASVAGATNVTFTASGLLVPDNIEIVSGDNQQIAVNRRSAPMIVRVTDEDGNDLEGVTVSFSSRGPAGATLTRSAITDRLGEAEADFVSRSAGTYTITARVTGIPTVTFTITVGDLADSIRIVSGNNQRGDPGTQLANPLVVEVLDDDGDTVSGVTVTFRVTGGGGSLSATSVSTNSSGRAQTTLTLGDSPGGNSVRASVSGVSTQVTFGATAVNPAPPEPVIHLGAGQRADSYWINTDSGTLHRLVGGSVENIASGVENVVSLVVTPDRLYWVEDTGNNSGRLRRSNLNGTNIQLIRDLTATPAGITVDTANNKIYMTNAWGKVQAINADGSGYAPNLITGLSDPKDIAVGSGKVYWITGGGTVHSANVDGSGTTQIAGGYDTLGSIAVGGGKVFWTEAISESDGNIHSANLNGTGVTEVVSLLAAPYGISVDAGTSKLYFTNSRGRIMQGNLDGSGIQIVASNLVALGDVSVPSGTAAPRPPGTFSQYDVNRDGTVDNTDAALVAAALGESPPSNPRLDVNGDGMVNFLDLLLVFDNRDNTNAAPVALAQNLPNVSREEIQNQIEQLLASDNQSATAQFTLAYLQNLLEIVTPEKTRLLANYPNPFNPETWIPYQLATSSEVQITIYNSAGREVRTLSLGHQSKGYYTDRSSAAYWDGRNVIGEAVSSGVYFYTLTTDRMSATRKMLILK